MNDQNNEINEVYNKVDELFGLRIKTQLKGTDLVFQEIRLIKNIISEEKYHGLIVNKREISFNNTSELYLGLIKVIELEKRKITDEIGYFEDHKNNDMTPDIIFIDHQLEMLYSREYKLSKLSDKIHGLLSR